MRYIITLILTCAFFCAPAYADVDVIKSGIVFRNADDVFRYHGWPSVAKAHNGDVYVVFSAFRAEHICPFGKTAICRASQTDLVFNDAQIINDTVLDDRDGGIISFGKNKMFLTWFTHSTHLYTDLHDSIINGISNPRLKELAHEYIESYKILPDSRTNGGSYYKISYDDGKTWGVKKQLPVSTPHGPIAAADGSLLYFGRGLYTEGPDKDKVSLYKSTNDGEDWFRVGDVPFPEGVTGANFHEPHIIELTNGELLGAIRAQDLGVSKYPYGNFTVFLTRSNDGGKTWSMPEPTGWDGSPPHFLRHSSGAIICTVGKRSAPFGNRAYISYDEGKTWSEPQNISPFISKSPDMGYPSSIELDDGSIMTVFYQYYENDGFASILYSLWKLL